MLPVEIVPVDGTTIVLRARGSELLILPHHIGELKASKSPKDFTSYFLANALLNRPARKLFEAWLRKDKSLWQRIYRTVQNEMDTEKIKQFEERMEAAENESEAKVGDKKPEAKAKKSAEAPAAEKVAAKPKEKAAPAEKPAKKKADAASKKKAVKSEMPKKAVKKAPAARKSPAAKSKKK